MINFAFNNQLLIVIRIKLILYRCKGNNFILYNKIFND